MSENKPEQLNSQAVPFFARFLEGQSFEDLSDQESEVIGGRSCGVTSKKKHELVQTRKYPSDQEDVVIVTAPGPFAITNKYPSDGDDDATPGIITSL
ncbi:MAG: microviridin/marinostatin family tricyclic proteinase inhibitor [Nostoc sp.]|uniref:microviridin/marinostatin family tricyclic proteinase inhibitor n=1 Tax=Nostoc sp. TaxID=1180 RepID=UPI002FFCAC64